MAIRAAADSLPAEPFEIVAANSDYEGLGFYGPIHVERVTTRGKPYPFFTLAEPQGLGGLDHRAQSGGAGHVDRVRGNRGRDASQDGGGPRRVRAVAGLANQTLIFCLPGSTGACRDGWNGILAEQLDSRHRPCNFAAQTRSGEHLL